MIISLSLYYFLEIENFVFWGIGDLKARLRISLRLPHNTGKRQRWCSKENTSHLARLRYKAGLLCICCLDGLAKSRQVSWTRELMCFYLEHSQPLTLSFRAPVKHTLDLLTSSVTSLHLYSIFSSFYFLYLCATFRIISSDLQFTH